MSSRIICISVLILLILAGSVSAGITQDITIYQALQIAEKAEMDQFTSVIKAEHYWVIKGTNLHNAKPAQLLINAGTGLVISARNITPETIILGENTYGYSGALFPSDKEFYKTDQIYFGFEIYQNDSRYFKMKHAIFIHTADGFVAYFMTGGPGMTK